MKILKLVCLVCLLQTPFLLFETLPSKFLLLFPQFLSPCPLLPSVLVAADQAWPWTWPLPFTRWPAWPLSLLVGLVGWRTPDLDKGTPWLAQPPSECLTRGWGDIVVTKTVLGATGSHAGLATTVFTRERKAEIVIANFRNITISPANITTA